MLVSGLRSRSLFSQLPLLRAVARGIRRGAGAWINLIVLLLVELLIRHLSEAAGRDARLAHAHARSIIQLERHLHIFVEPSWQQAVLLIRTPSFPGHTVSGATVAHLLSTIYAGGHLGWLASLLFWLYLFRRSQFVAVRNVTVLSTLLTIGISILYPVAPPRFALADAPYYVKDLTGPVLPERIVVQLSHSNPYAATPSSHTLWALITGLGLFLTATDALKRLIAISFPAVMIMTVIVTGNHYVVDCVASTVVFGVCCGLEAWRSRLQPGRPSTPPTLERRRSINLRPLDYPLTLAVVAALILALGSDATSRTCGIALLGLSVLALLVARHTTAAGHLLRASTPRAEWWCGLFFIAGATGVYSNARKHIRSPACCGWPRRWSS